MSRRRKARYTKKVSSGLTNNMSLELAKLQRKTGLSKAALIREAINVLVAKYKEAGY